MKFFLAFALIAVASATHSYKPAFVMNEQVAEIAQIVEAIYSPSTDPATAAALEQLLLETLGVPTSPISVGPAIVDAPVVSPIHVGAEVIDFPVPTPVVAPVQPSPVIIGEIPAGAPSPLVQILVKVNGQEITQTVPAPVAVATPVAPTPVAVATPVAPGPVNVVDNVVAPVSPVSVGTPVAVSPVSVGTPVVVSPVAVGTPVLPSPVVALPETLN